MSDIAIKVENLSKLYRIGLKEQIHDTLGEAISSFVRQPLNNLKRLRRLTQFSPEDSSSEDTIWALKDISFEVKRGEVVGIIGRNGAGKSTLLKILARITEPTSGRAIVNGRVASLLEVGTGFHSELTGRENVYLNGTVLGMSKAEIDNKFNEIVSFAEVEKFIDTPVKRYSSGMKVRLAFAVAAHLEPEILLVDEVLAVGDVAFQKKCLGKMGDVAKEGRTVLFVSHNMGAITDLCQRAIWLHEGRAVEDGKPDEVIEAYLSQISGQPCNYLTENREFQIEELILENSRGERTTRFLPGCDLILTLKYNARKTLISPYVWITVQTPQSACFSANMFLDGRRPDVLYGRGSLSCRFKAIPLLPNTYIVKMAIRARDGTTAIVAPQEVATFEVVGDLREYGFDGDMLHRKSRDSVPLIIPYEWTLPDGSTHSVDLHLPEKNLS